MTASRIGSYVVVDLELERDDIVVLVEALSYAILPNHRVDKYLQGIFTGIGPSGGDPGWAIDRTVNEAGVAVYDVFMSGDISGQDIEEARYDEATVKRHVRRTLENFAAAHPE
jgi:hypothetical protein